MADSMRESITTQTVSSIHVKQKKAMLKFLVIYGRLKPCKIKTIRCKNYFATLDSTRESISTQTVSSGHVNKTNSMQKLFCYGRLNTRVNYDSNCFVKQCEAEKSLS